MSITLRRLSPDITLLRTFAAQHRLHSSRDIEDGTTVIRGRAGHIYEYNDSELALVILTAEGKDVSIRRWSSIKRRCLGAGMTLRQDGDYEGALSFNPSKEGQSKIAVRVTGVRPRKQLSPERHAKALLNLKRPRQTEALSIVNLRASSPKG